MGATVSATGRFFITPSAIADWQAIIAPGSTYEEALADIIDWSRDAKPQAVGPIVNSKGKCLVRYRARKPLQCYFIVDESPAPGLYRNPAEAPLPVITGIAPPHAGWVPGGKPKPDYAALPKSEGRPEVRARVPESVRAWVDSKGQGWLCKLLCQLKAEEEKTLR